ncbi:MAG: hypothetical protein ABIH92_00350, partial [Nanoarchaeota archaeon]
MNLKFKPINLEAGRPIAFVSEKLAEKLNIVEGSRIEVSYKQAKLILPVNLAEKFLSEKEVSFSDEAVLYLKIKRREKVEISIALEPRSTHYILKKMNGKPLSKKEIYEIIR